MSRAVTTNTDARFRIGDEDGSTVGHAVIADVPAATPGAAVGAAERAVDEGAAAVLLRVPPTGGIDHSLVAATVAAVVGGVTVPVLVETARRDVLHTALAAGAAGAYDPSALADPGYAAVAAEGDACVVLGALDVDAPVATRLARLVERARSALDAGMPASRVAVDPGPLRPADVGRLARAVAGPGTGTVLSLASELEATEVRAMIAVALSSGWAAVRTGADVLGAVQVARIVAAIRRAGAGG
jgi:hypothetical protein